MTLQLDQKAREAVIHGPPRKLVGRRGADGHREHRPVASPRLPDGLIRSFQADGTLREQTFADTLAAVGRNRRPAAQPRRRSWEPDRLAARRPPRLRFLFLGVIAGGRDSDSLSPASPILPRPKSSKFWWRALNVRRLSPTRPRPTSIGLRLCCPTPRSSTFPRSPAKAMEAKMKTSIPATSPT